MRSLSDSGTMQFQAEKEDRCNGAWVANPGSEGRSKKQYENKNTDDILGDDQEHGS